MSAGDLAEVDRLRRPRRAIASRVRSRCMRSVRPLAAPPAPPRWRARSRPFSPITTSRLRRASPGAPGPVELVAEARADALHEQAHRLARDLDEALHAQHVVRLGDRGEPARPARRGRSRPGCRRRSCRNRRGRGPPPRRGARGAWRGRPRPRRRGRAARSASMRPSRRLHDLDGARHRARRSRPARGASVVRRRAGRPC